MWPQKKQKRIYLDHAAATPVRKEVRLAMEPFWSEDFGNAGAIHKEGVAASVAIESARADIAKLLHTRSEGVVFTANGTESNNLAIIGTLRKRFEEGVSYADMEVVATAIEHPSILQTLAYAKTLGVCVVYAPLTEDGIIDTKAFESCVSKRTVLVSVAYANSEIGTVQPLQKIARIVRAKERELGTRIYVHADAAQAPLWLPCGFDRLGVDLMSLDGGKCYGPKGVGVLAFRHGVHLSPVLFGGNQESGLRAGTENTALIVGMAVALRIAQEGYEKRTAKIQTIRDKALEGLLSIPGVVLNGSHDERIANNINISIPGIDSEFAVVTLDEKGIACSTKSACGGAKGDGSHVVRSVYADEARARSTIRFTLGEDSTQAELHHAIAQLKEHVEAMRAFSKTI